MTGGALVLAAALALLGGNAYRGWTDVVQGGCTGSYRWGHAALTIPDGTELGWRYVTKDGNWVMVKVNGAPKADPSNPDVPPNWVFVARNCLTL